MVARIDNANIKRGTSARMPDLLAFDKQNIAEGFQFELLITTIKH